MEDLLALADDGTVAGEGGLFEHGGEVGDLFVVHTDAALLDEDGESKYVFRTGDEITLRLKYHCVEPEKTPKGNFGYGIFREDSVHCYGTNVEIESDSWVALQPNGEIEVRFRNHLLPGRYFLDVAVHAPDGTYYDDIRRIQAFAVTSEHRDIGVCRLESQWFVDGKALERKTGE